MQHHPAAAVESAEKHSQRRVWAEIDLVALAHNLREIRERSGGARILLVVKANAYGHGMQIISKHALRVGIAGLCVATPGEALELRRDVGDDARIVILGPWLPEEAEMALRSGAELCIHQKGDWRTLESLSARLGLRSPVHLNIDTGMGRLGLSSPTALETARALRSSKNLSWVGTMTHLASARGPEDAIAREQLARFDGFCRDATERSSAAQRSILAKVPMCHAEASSAVFSEAQSRYGTIRPGISAYGALPCGTPHGESLVPVLSLRSRVASLRTIESGCAVGYGSTWRATRRTRLATLSVGYADGLPWRLAGRQGFALVRGQRVPIVGRVSMDSTTLDVSDVSGAERGDVATLIGADGEERIRCEDLADLTGTIPYEIFCSIGPRVERFAIRENEALSDLEVPRSCSGKITAAPLKRRQERAFSPKMAQSLPTATPEGPEDSGPSVFEVDQEA